MIKRVLTYSFVEGLSKGLNKLLFLLLPLIIPVKDFGYIGLVVALEVLIPYITLLGFDRAVLRFYNDKFPNFEATIFKSIFCAHWIFIFLAFLTTIFGVQYAFGLRIFPDLILILLLVYFQSKHSIKLNILRSTSCHNEFFKWRIIQQISKLIFSLIALYFFNNYMSYIIASLVSATLLELFFKVDYSNENEKKFNNETFKRLFVFSWPMIFHGIAGNLLGNADKFIIDKYMSVSDVGQYSFAYTIGSMIVFSYLGLSIYFEPSIYKQKNINALEMLIKTFRSLSLLTGSLALLILILVVEFLLPKVYPSYTSIFWSIPYIAISFLLYPFYLSGNYRLSFFKKTKLIASISIISSALNIGCNIYFIPKYGVMAAVIINIFTYFIQAFCFTLGSNQKIFSIEMRSLLMTSTIIAIVLITKTHLSLIPLTIIFFNIFIHCKDKVEVIHSS
jgi:O-antigen/teichoic acid export membrane protein